MAERVAFAEGVREVAVARAKAELQSCVKRYWCAMQSNPWMRGGVVRSKRRRHLLNAASV
ncbi:hypothetical protein [uncultured Slackia sp.]|uniref:hypothetical protein n=1 Tax=uncultured Slackia sp. TaxID=665903 RepID=UPI0026752019|nr:hypothetical protein [uncultured Slackia sp.]